MKLSRITTLLTVTLSIFISTQAVAADRGVFASKSQKQHELSNWEENKLKAEFKSRFNSASSGAFQKLNNNPWEAKRSKQKQHNQKMLDEGRRPGSASWVRNGPAIDEQGGIYIPSLEHMHKVVWDGTRLSTDPEDGAWVAQYRNGTGVGTGATGNE